MAYLLYSIAVLLLVFITAAFLTRTTWHPILQKLIMRFPTVNIPFSGAREYLYARLPQTFAGDVEAGLSSDTFDLSSNIHASDSRAGLDDTAKHQILTIMKKRRLKFDEARRVYMENRFSQNGISPDGRPRDPKFVSFS